MDAAILNQWVQMNNEDEQQLASAGQQPGGKRGFLEAIEQRAVCPNKEEEREPSGCKTMREGNSLSCRRKARRL